MATTERDERLWSGYTCEVCGWFELRPGGRLWCPHCERLGRGKAFTMKQVNVVPAARLDRLRDVLYNADQFIESVTHWDGQQDDQEEVLREIRTVFPDDPKRDA